MKNDFMSLIIAVMKLFVRVPTVTYTKGSGPIQKRCGAFLLIQMRAAFFFASRYIHHLLALKIVLDYLAPNSNIAMQLKKSSCPRTSKRGSIPSLENPYLQ